MNPVSNTATGLVRPLFDGPLDLIGDVHGEVDALKALFERLGYDRHGVHPAGYRPVFVGDLTDRGPDSPAVVAMVRDLVEANLAQCVAGNHELNLVRGTRKHGNHWAYPPEARHEREFGPTRHVDESERQAVLRFFASLPVALERPDLRVVHAAWDLPSIAQLRVGPAALLDAYEHFDAQLAARPYYQRLQAAAQRERALHGDAATSARLCPVQARADAYKQRHHPLRVVTSGLETPIRVPFEAGGKWRHVTRVPWWQSYRSRVPVVFGHYWRWWNPLAHSELSKGEPNLFLSDGAEGWHHNRAGRPVAYCVDYSVGARFKERRLRPDGPFHGRLAALRWPQRRVVYDC